VAHVVDSRTIDLRPAPVTRDWMDAPGARHAYRCLPLSIANGYGWVIGCPSGFTALWNGDPAVGAIHVEPDLETQAPAIDHFGAGILTFHVPCLFRTEAGVDLMVTGPLNEPKDGIAALTGVVETDWTVATFTMNWRFTRPNVTVRFEAGEPICQIFPVRRGDVETTEPVWRPLSETPELQAGHAAWATSRDAFNRDLLDPDRPADAPTWQKDYHHGRGPRGSAEAPPDHRTRLQARRFRRADGSDGA
jgi:hypothetical protein